MKTLYKDIKIPKIKKDSLIRDSKLFKWVDPCFESYGASEPHEGEAKARNFEVREMTDDMTFAQMFPNPEKMAMTQGQILSFVKNNKDKLRHADYATFFLLKSGSQFFVADVSVDSDGLGVDVNRFEDGYVWGAENRHRMVVPQPDSETFEPSDAETISDLGTLTDEAAIAHLKKFGYTITRQY